MTTTLAYRSQQPRGHDGFAQMVRAEFTKLRTVRAWVITLGIAAGLVVALAWVGTPHTGICVVGPGSRPACHTPSAPTVPLGPAGEPVVDTFSFVRQPMIGNGTLTVRVTSLTGAAAPGNGGGPGAGGEAQNARNVGLMPWAKAGLIITESTTAGSPYAAVMVTPRHGVRLQDDYTGDVAGLPGAVSARSPRWLRLTRAGEVVTGYDSFDGTHWSKIGAERLVGMPRMVQVGLFVTSPDEYTDGGNSGSASLATGVFDHVHLTGEFPHGSWHDQVVGRNPESYNTVRSGLRWFRHSDGAFIISGSGDIAPQVSSPVLEGLGETASLQGGGTFGLIAVIVLATLFITSEYRRGLIRTTFSASPRRVKTLAAKAVVIGSATFVAGSLASVLAEAITRHVLPGNGNYVFPLSAATEIRVILGTGLLFAVAAIGIMALATVIRRSAGAVVTGVVLFVLPFILSHSLSSGSDWLLRLTPAAAFAIQGSLPRFAQVAGAYSMSNGYYPLGPWVGFAVLCAWSSVAFAVAAWVIRQRDV